MSFGSLKSRIEALVMASDSPMSVSQITNLIRAEEARGGISKSAVREALVYLTEDYRYRGIELQEVASGFQFRVRREFSDTVGKIFEDRKNRYSRAFLETLAIIAYRQPVTRGEIEHIRGVAVSSNIMRQLLDREWVKQVGHRDVPGRPGLYATTSDFLDYFGLKSLEDMPSLEQVSEGVSDPSDLFSQTLSEPQVGPDDVEHSQENLDSL